MGKMTPLEKRIITLRQVIRLNLIAVYFATYSFFSRQ